MLIIMGKSASGKDAVVKSLVNTYGYKKIVTYTSRPKRNKEDDNTYHFISEEEFINKIQDNFFLEYKTYNTVRGKWYYGSAKEDYKKSDDKTVIILTPDGYRDFLRECPNVSHKAIYLYANIETIKKRLASRGDNKEEAVRRIEHDNQDFKGVGELSHKIVYNNAGYDLKNVVAEVVKYAEG